VYRVIISDVKVFCSIALMVTLIPASAWCAGPALTPVQIRSALVEGMRYKSLNQFFQRKQISGYKHIRGTTVTLATGLSGTDIQANFFNEWWAVAAQGAAARQQMRQITPDQIESTGLLYVRVYAGAVGAVSTSKLNRRYGSKQAHLVLQIGDRTIQPVQKEMVSRSDESVPNLLIGLPEGEITLDFAFDVTPAELESPVMVILIDGDGKHHQHKADLKGILTYD